MFRNFIYFCIRWSIVDALALNASLDSREIQNYFNAVFVKGEVPDKVLKSEEKGLNAQNTKYCSWNTLRRP